MADKAVRARGDQATVGFYVGRYVEVTQPHCENSPYSQNNREELQDEQVQVHGRIGTRAEDQPY